MVIIKIVINKSFFSKFYQVIYIIVSYFDTNPTINFNTNCEHKNNIPTYL